MGQLLPQDHAWPVENYSSSTRKAGPALLHCRAKGLVLGDYTRGAESRPYKRAGCILCFISSSKVISAEHLLRTGVQVQGSVGWLLDLFQEVPRRHVRSGSKRACVNTTTASRVLYTPCLHHCTFSSVLLAAKSLLTHGKAPRFFEELEVFPRSGFAGVFTTL